MAGHVFISYSRVDTGYVDQLAAHLQNQRIPVWIDRERISSGDRWARLIRDQVDSSAAVVVIMSPAAEDSEWVGLEVERARVKGKPILPLLLDGDVFFALGTLHYHDVRGGQNPPDDFVRRLRQLVSAPVSVPVGAGAVPADADAAGIAAPARTPEEEAAAATRRWRLMIGAAFVALFVIGGLIMLNGFEGPPDSATPAPSGTSFTRPPMATPTPSPSGATPAPSSQLRAYGAKWIATATDCRLVPTPGAVEVLACDLPGNVVQDGLDQATVLLSRYANVAARDAAFAAAFGKPSCASQVGTVMSPAVSAAPVRNDDDGCYAEIGDADRYQIYGQDPAAPLATLLVFDWSPGTIGSWTGPRHVWDTNQA